MNAAELHRQAIECRLDLFPVYRSLLWRLRHAPNDAFIRERLARAIEECRRAWAGGDILAPHPDASCGIATGDLPVAFQEKHGIPVRFDFARNPGQSHATVMSAVTGLQGVGKSTVGMALARGASKLQGVSAWCIDPSAALHLLLESDVERFAVVQPGTHLRVNPFAPTYLRPDCPAAEYLAETLSFAGSVIELVAECYERQDSRFLLNEVAEHYIRLAANSWKDACRPLPSFATLVQCLGAPLPKLNLCLPPYKARDFGASAQGVLTHLERQSSGFFDTAASTALPRLLGHNLILDVSRMGKQEIGFVLSWLITYLRRYAEHQGWIADARLHQFLLVDDLQQLLGKHGRSALPERLTVLRQRGIHLCSMVHNFSSLSDFARGNIDLICHVGPLADHEDRRAFTSWAGMKDDPATRDYLARIARGHGLVRHLKHPYARAIAVRYQPITKATHDTSLETRLQQARANILGTTNWEPSLTHAQLTTPPTARTPNASGAGRNAGPASVAAGLSEHTQRYLESIAEPLGWTQPQKVHLLNAGIGNSKEKRDQIVRDTYGLVLRHHKVTTGRGSGITLTELTPQGWKTIGKTPTPIPGKGSLPHKYYQYRTNEALRNALPNHPAPRLEYKIGAHQYDLIQATPDGRLLGIEIAATEQDRNEAENAIDGLLPHQHRIHAHIILAATDDAYTRVKKDLDAAKLLNPVHSRIHLERIGEFWTHTASLIARWTA